MYDTIIIGAGMSGLAAGVRLAHYDQKVCILERHTTIGGLNSFYRLRGRNYDVGLHAVTNYTPKGTKKGPLARLLRQLRFKWDDFSLVPQKQSSIVFPGVRLKFSNDFELLRSQIHEAFPRQKDNFERFLKEIVDYDDLDEASNKTTAREVMGRHITEPLLIEMLLCPTMYYGSATENDMEWGQFCIMFRSIFYEGFARPWRGVRLILKHLTRRFKELGGELKLRCGVSRFKVHDNKVAAVVLDDGTEIMGRRVLSSAGWVETMRLCDKPVPEPEQGEAGRMSFVESISVLDRQPADLGLKDTIIFYNDSQRFSYTAPDDLVDLRSGVICTPNNFDYDEPLPEGILRVTSIASYDRWNQLSEEEYRREKLRWYDAASQKITEIVPEFRHRVVETDMFTPMTVRRFTGHVNGTIYGSPKKKFYGTTHLNNLFICGTDQGFMGIVGTIVSGISMANRHCLT